MVGAQLRDTAREPAAPASAFAAAQAYVLAGVIATAVFLRLFELQYGQYGSDDERLWTLALKALADRVLPSSGIRSSMGLNNGPFQAYLVMPAAMLAATPLAGAIVVALVNSLAVYVLYRFIREFFGSRPALIAAALFASSSWAVIYARRMQAQDMLVPFQVLFFWSAARWLTRGRTIDLALMFAWLAIVAQVYVLGAVHLACAVLVLVLGWRRLRPVPLLLGIALFGLLTFRYLAGTVLPGVSTFSNVLSGTPSLDRDSLTLALIMATHKGYQTIAGQAGSVFDSTSGFEGLLVTLEELLFAAGFVLLALRCWAALRPSTAGLRKWLIARAAPPDSAVVCALLLIWAVVPTAAFLRHSVPLYPYYFVSLIPLPAIFTALLLDRFWSQGGGPAAVLLSVNGLVLAGVFFLVIPRYYTRNDYGLPYSYTFQVESQVEQLAAERHAGRIYVDGDMDPSEVMTSVLLRRGYEVFWLDDYRTPELEVPPAGAASAIYVTMADDTETARYLAREFADRQAFAVPLPGEGITIRAYAIDPADVQRSLDRLLTEPLGLQAANGMLLRDFQADRRLQPGKSLGAALSWTWQGDVDPGKARYSIFGHLVDASGESRAQADYPIEPNQDWRPGQRVVQWLSIPVPTTLKPGRYVLEVGVYSQDGVVRQRLVDGSGRDVGGSVSIPGFVLPPAAPAGSAPATPESRFADGIDLEGHQVAVQPGKIELTLDWAARAEPSRDYTVFVHVIDPSGKVVVQADSQPLKGDFPTGTWRAGDRVADQYELQVPPGQYEVQVGLYYLPTLERLSGAPLALRLDVP